MNTFLENIYKSEGRKSLSNDKNNSSVNNNINFELFFLCKIFIYLKYEQKEDVNIELNKYLLEEFSPLLNDNIKTYKNNFKKNFNEELLKDYVIYNEIKEYYSGNIWTNIYHLNTIQEFLE